MRTAIAPTTISLSPRHLDMRFSTCASSSLFTTLSLPCVVDFLVTPCLYVTVLLYVFSTNIAYPTHSHRSSWSVSMLCCGVIALRPLLCLYAYIASAHYLIPEIAICVISLLFWSVFGKTLARAPKTAAIRLISVLTLISTALHSFSVISAAETATAIHSQFLDSLILIANVLLTVITLRSPREEYSPMSTGEPSQCPERSSPLLSRLMFSWMNGLLRQANSAPLREKDVWELDSFDQSQQLYSRFKQHWETRGDSSLTAVLLRVFWKRILATGLVKVLFDLSEFLKPFLLKLFIDYISGDRDTTVAYALCVCIFVGPLFRFFLDAHYYHSVKRMSMQVRSILISVIFRQSMDLTWKGRKQVSEGKIQNLISTDTEEVDMMLECCHQIWADPVKVLVSLGLLYHQMGPASLIGASLLLTLLPTQKYLIKKMSVLTTAIKEKRDERLKQTNEVIDSISIVKFYGWEEAFRDAITATRNEELSLLRRLSLYRAVNMFFIFVIPLFVSVLAFSAYVLFGNALTSAVAFSSICLFDILNWTMFSFPSTINQLIQYKVSVARIQEFLDADAFAAGNDRENSYSPPRHDTLAVSVKNADFGWDDSSPVLSSVDLEIKQGELVVILGAKTGSGKSTLLNGLIGELAPLNPEASSVSVRGSIGYVPQLPWIFNATIRDNILYGCDYDRARYQRTLKACALVSDLSQLPAGDFTEIGEKGVNLSGGQKQRVSLARSVYRNADVYVMDSPLSALDASVALSVFNECVQTELKDATRILVTNQLNFVGSADKIIYLDNNRIAAVGSPEEMSGLIESIQNHEMELEAQSQDTDDISLCSPSSHRDEPSVAEEFRSAGAKLIAEEERETGKVSLAVVLTYLGVFGSVAFTTTLVAWFVLGEAFAVISTYWISVWSQSGGAEDAHSPHYYIGVYALFSLLHTVLVLLYQVMMALGTNSAGKQLHERMLFRVLAAPIGFFHATPVGRIINRFSKDQSQLDEEMAICITICVAAFLAFIGQVTLITAMLPAMAFLSVPLVLLYLWYASYFQAANRELKRLDSITRSPLYSSLASVLKGAESIRTYHTRDFEVSRYDSLVNTHIKIYLANFSSFRWIVLRLSIMGGSIVFMTAVASIFMDLPASLAGLILASALNLTDLMNWAIQFGSQAENSFNAVERIKEYAEIPVETESQVVVSSDVLDWPSNGEIAFNNVWMRYRSDLPSALKGISFHIRGGESIGIVGQSGAGKSSILSTLFRFVDPHEGSVMIDGVDTRLLSLNQVRTSLSVIPQDPVLFMGSVRSNLDPFNEHSDPAIWGALERSYLQDYVRNSGEGLEMHVESNGRNFSVGQRQLLCLARALLRNTKVLVLDEATSNVDMDTDALIQKTIREDFRDCTRLIIAHRLKTIIDWYVCLESCTDRQ